MLVKPYIFTYVILSPDVPEGAVKGIFRFLSQAVGFYRDGRSRYAALRLINSLTKAHLDASVKALVGSLEGLAQNHKKVIVPR